MNALMVGYDLHRPGQDYGELIEFLKSQSTWWHALDSTWIVKTGMTAVQMRDEIKRQVDANDKILVLDVTGDDWATLGLSKRANEWLQEQVAG